jgi:hypothetical protein
MFVDRWVTPVMVILAAVSVVFAATWTMASRFGGPDQFAGGHAPRIDQGPTGRFGGTTQSNAIGAPMGSGTTRQAPITAGEGVVQSVDPPTTPPSGSQSSQAPTPRNRLAPIDATGASTQGIAPATGDAPAAPRQRESGRQGARASGGETDDHAEGTNGERSFGERTGRSRERR